MKDLRRVIKICNTIWHAIPNCYARAVFSNLCEHRDDVTNISCPSIKQIALEELMSENTVKRSIKLLSNLKIITINKQWKSNNYIINDKDISYLKST